MSLLDDWLAKLRGKATEEAGKAAVGAAAAGAQKAVSGIAEGFLSFAEGELADARDARGLQEGEEPEGVLPGSSAETDGSESEPTEAPVAAPPPPSARERREAREAKARDELARLKELMGKSDD